jgi:UDP-N-acetylglucosamine 2-epimerase (non-hydrolysing)/GDP/UDP-N,N'-diacetylbacillosamine 2-epimerase (hydrolysing)
MGQKRLIGVFTGHRAEYGLLFPVLRAIETCSALEYRLIVGGAHLSNAYGRTIEEIYGDGFVIHAKAEIQMPEDTPFGTAMAIGSGIQTIASALLRIQPDILLVYGDRWESFSAMIAATQMNIPSAHIEGGDLTEGGALDDSVRHAMTKLAHLHFTTNEQATNRILAMGEEPWRVHTAGLPAVDMIKLGNYASRDDVVRRFGLDLSNPLILFTQHSVATEFQNAAAQIRPSLAVLGALADQGVQVIITNANNDAGGQRIKAEIEVFAACGRPNIQVCPSLGRINYHGVLALARDPAVRLACGGNSSSGLKETPAFGCPAVDIGSRQQGRLRAANVLHVGYDQTEIMAALTRALYDDTFRDYCRKVKNPYGDGNAGQIITDILANIPINQHLLRKRMTLEGVTKDGQYR